MILNDLSSSLRRDVQLFLCRDLVATVPFFQDCEIGTKGNPTAFFIVVLREALLGLVQSIISLLQPAYYLKNDLVLTEGEMAWHMYFIRVGGKCALTCVSDTRGGG